MITVNVLSVVLEVVSVCSIVRGKTKDSNCAVVLEIHEQSSKIWSEDKQNILINWFNGNCAPLAALSSLINGLHYLNTSEEKKNNFKVQQMTHAQSCCEAKLLVLFTVITVMISEFVIHALGA